MMADKCGVRFAEAGSIPAPASNFTAGRSIGLDGKFRLPVFASVIFKG
jgi:hypothetical protein